MNSTNSQNYLQLLKIRQTAGKRNKYIIGSVFIVSFVLLIALGMLDRLNDRSLFLSAAIIVPIGIGFISAWVKLEIINSTIELIDNLQAG